jgi:hypothetical protein
MSSKKRRPSGGNPARQREREALRILNREGPDGPWQPLVQYEQNPVAVDIALQNGTRPAIAVFGNDTYDVSVYVIGDDNSDGLHPVADQMYHLSIKRRDRHVIRDWRHLQAIKNEVFGAERMAFEIYPPESQLVDSANQFHLWVLPADFQLPFGFDEQLLSSDMQVEDFNAARERGEHKGRQRPFQMGLPVAEGRNDTPYATESMSGTKGTTRTRVPSRIP